MALEKNLDIAVERLNPSSFDFSLEALRANYNPTATSTLGLQQRPTSCRPVSWWAVPGSRTTRSPGTSACSSCCPGGAGHYQVAVQQPPQRQQQRVRHVQPAVQHPAQRRVRAAAAARARHRQHAHGADHHADQPRTLRRPGPDDGHRDAGRRAQRLLGPGLRPGSRQRRRRARCNWPRSSSRTTRCASKSARWRRSTSCRPQAEAATRRQTLAALEAQAQTAELALKRLIVSGTADPMWGARLRPVDRPDAHRAGRAARSRRCAPRSTTAPTSSSGSVTSRLPMRTWRC